MKVLQVVRPLAADLVQRRPHGRMHRRCLGSLFRADCSISPAQMQSRYIITNSLRRKVPRKRGGGDGERWGWGGGGGGDDILLISHFAPMPAAECESPPQRGKCFSISTSLLTFPCSIFGFACCLFMTVAPSTGDELMFAGKRDIGRSEHDFRCGGFVFEN